MMVSSKLTMIPKKHFWSLAIKNGQNQQQCPFKGATTESSTIDLRSTPLTKPIEENISNYKINAKETVKSYDEIPGPKGLPFIGTLMEYTSKNSKYNLNQLFLAQVDRTKEYGPIYKERIGPNESVYITSARIYEKILKVEGPTPYRKQLEPMLHYRRQRNLALGMTNSQGEEWRANRVILGRKMTRIKDVETYIPWMSDVADSLIERIQYIRNKKGIAEGLDLEICKWSLESLCTFIYEDRIGCLDTPPRPQANLFVESTVGYFRTMHPMIFGAPIYKLIPTPSWKTHSAYADNMVAMGHYFVQKFLETPEARMNTSLLAHLMKQPHLSQDEINFTIIDMMMGSIETTTNTMLWLLYCLARNQEKQQILYKEIMNIIPEENPTFNPDVLAQFVYLKACLKETFRLFPIAYATSRLMVKDVEIGGYVLPYMTHVQGCLWPMGRDPSIFTNIEKFEPERWIRAGRKLKSEYGEEVSQQPTNACQKDESNLPNSDMAPFVANLAWGHGARQCPGRRLAEQEIYITLAKILKKFKLQSSQKVKPIMKPIIMSDQELEIEFIPRNN